MSFKLEDHIVYIDSLKTEMVPYGIAKQILEEQSRLSEENLKKISEGLEKSEDTLNRLIESIYKTALDIS